MSTEGRRRLPDGRPECAGFGEKGSSEAAGEASWGTRFTWCEAGGIE